MPYDPMKSTLTISHTSSGYTPSEVDDSLCDHDFSEPPENQ